jgi:hypothetical protein
MARGKGANHDGPNEIRSEWTKFLANLGKFPVSDLSVKMMMNRIKMKILFDPSEASKQQAIGDAYDFFIKNQATVKEDIKLIFG